MPAHKKHRILVLEDEPLLLHSLAKILQNFGYTVDEAMDSKQAAAAIKKHKPCLIFLDILLPGQSGLEFLEELRQDPKYKDLPVFVLTQFPEFEYVQKAKALAVKEYFVKAKHSLREIADRTEELFREPGGHVCAECGKPLLKKTHEA